MKKFGKWIAWSKVNDYSIIAKPYTYIILMSVIKPALLSVSLYKVMIKNGSYWNLGFSVSASRSDVNLDYLYLLRDGILQPLIKNGADGVKTALKFMHSYHLLREDLDNLVELCHWSRSKDYMKMIDSKVCINF